MGHDIGNQALMDEEPRSHEDGEPTDVPHRAGLTAEHEDRKNAEDQSEVIERPNAKDPADVKLLALDGACGLLLAKQELCDEEGAEGEEEAQAESAGIDDGVEAGIKSAEDGSSRHFRVVGKCVVKEDKQERNEAHGVEFGAVILPCVLLVCIH